MFVKGDFELSLLQTRITTVAYRLATVRKAMRFESRRVEGGRQAINLLGQLAGLGELGEIAFAQFLEVW